MSSDARNFNKVFFLQGRAPKEIHAILIEKLGGHAPLYAPRHKLDGQVYMCDFSTCVAPRHGRTKTVTTLEIIDQIHELNQ